MKNETMTAADAVAHIRAQVGDTTKFRTRHRGYIDWKFGELAEYLGYAAALDYARRMRIWYDYQQKYQGCLLDTTFEAFLEAEKSLTLQPSTP